MQITASLITLLAPGLNLVSAQSVADSVNQSAPLYQINTPQRMAAILSQVAHESAGFTARNESLNYSAQGLINTFSYYRKNPALAQQHGRTTAHPANQELIANTVYADQNRQPNQKLGNTQPNDGWFFRGAGPMQLTGRAAFTTYAKYKNADIVTLAGELRTSDLWGMDSAFWFFVIYKKLLDKADAGDIRGISIAVNGGTAGLPQRIQLYQKALEALSVPA